MNDSDIKNDAKLSQLALDIIQDKDIRITELWEERCRIYESLKEAKSEIEKYEKIVGKLVVNDDGIAVGLLNGNKTEYIPKKVYVIWENMAVKRAKSETIKEFQQKSKKELIKLYKKYYRLNDF